MKTAINWSEKFNALPYDVRIIGCAMEQRTRIQQLIAEKVRLKQHYDESVAEIDEQMQYAESHLKAMESPSQS